LPGVSVGLFGDRLHLVCLDPEPTMATTQKALADAGVNVLTIHAVEPSLEDVFVSALVENGP
jgi:ABC-2 type transport system ATP-binding protein